MGYCTKIELGHHLGNELSVLLQEAYGTYENTDNDALLSLAIYRADSVIDSYIAGKIPLPLDTPIPGLIFDACIDITTYKLVGRRGGKDLEETFKEAHDRAILNLKAIQNGDLTLPGIKEDVTNLIRSTTTGEAKTFTKETLDELMG